MGSKMRMLAVALWVAAMASMATAQVQYNNTDGYACTTPRQSCTAYALYRTFQGNESLSKVANYFNKTATSVANTSGVSNLSPTAGMRLGQPLYIPLDCGCHNVTQQMQVQHTIVSGDTFWLLSVTIYGGLTTWQAMVILNPTKDIYNLQIGDNITVPIFCACPTEAQTAAGTNFLLTHTIYAGETLSAISGYYGLTTSELAAANQIATNASLGENTTLIVPLATLPPLATINFAVPTPPPPSDTSPPGPSPAPVVVTKSASNTPLYVGIAVGAFGLTLAAVFAAMLLMKACQSKQPQDPPKGYESYYQNAPSGSIKDSKPNAYHLEMLAGMSDVVGSDKPILLSYQELQDATQDFSEANLIQGSVYRGRINGQLVAIKQMKGNMSQELKILCQVHHSNLVRPSFLSPTLTVPFHCDEPIM